jgi:hypothetical protein
MKFRESINLRTRERIQEKQTDVAASSNDLRTQIGNLDANALDNQRQDERVQERRCGEASGCVETHLEALGLVVLKQVVLEESRQADHHRCIGGPSNAH